MSTIYVTQDGPANALALNKDCTQVVIAGRNVFKVFSIDEEEFSEICNLRVGKNINLNFSCNDVAWSTIDEHILATAATNGAVVVWNLSRQGRSKQEHVFIDHKRTVNKVSFHGTEASWLISGSQDGTMKCFDLRTREATKTFFSNTESVRDVQFNPHTPCTFAAVSENGTVQLWDVRRPERCIHQFTAHSGPVFACDWHPESGWLATASRDKTIKVWDLTGKPSLEYTIHTIASVGHVKWRPQRKYHIASCALVLDCSINVWDVRRPYIPFASFNEHKDVATGVAWRGDPHVFLSTSRDNTLYRHSFRDAIRPATNANPQGVTINCKGNIFHARKTTAVQPLTAKLSGLIRKVPASSEQFHSASSALQQYNARALKTSRVVRECAEKYLLSGKSITELCKHNANVAASMGRHQVSLVWKILQILCLHQSDPIPPFNSQNDLPSVGDSSSLGQYGLSEETEPGDASDLGLGLGIGLGNSRATLGAPLGDGDADGTLESSVKNSFLYIGAHDAITDWTLSSEAFCLKHEVGPPEPSQPPTMFPGQIDCTVTVIDQPSTLKVSQPPLIASWDPNSVLASCLNHHIELGDFQTTASVLLVLGHSRASQIVDENTIEHWITVYVEHLYRLKMFDVATEIIRLCWIPSIGALNQRSTTMHTSCGQCNKSLIKSGWLCSNCQTPSSALCCVCHQVVRGLYAWCQGCSHGGHVAHLQQWLSKNKECPTGCGHNCEY